jgi:hypothetical protein
MDLYLMQHGQATPETEDPERPLRMPVKRRFSVSLKEPGLLASGSAAACTAENCAAPDRVAVDVHVVRVKCPSGFLGLGERGACGYPQVGSSDGQARCAIW